MAINVTCELTITNTTSSNRTGVVYFQLDTTGEYFRHEGLVQIYSSTTLEHTFYEVDETVNHIIYAYDANFVLLDTYVLGTAIYGELTSTLDGTTIHNAFPVNNTSTATLTISVFFSLNSGDAVRYTYSVPPSSSYTFTHDFTSVNVYEDNIIYVRNSEFTELAIVTIKGLTPEDIFTYTDITAIYADDVDYNDIITCSMVVTNNLSTSQLCIIYFKLGDYLVQQTYTILAGQSHTFTYDFENVDIFVENIVTFHDSTMNQLSSVTIAATPPFEMYFEATDEMKTIQIKLQRDLFTYSYVDWGDETIQELRYTLTDYTKEYAENGTYKITIFEPQNIIYFYLYTQTVNTQTAINQIYIYAGQISKLRKTIILYIYNSPASYNNVTCESTELLKLKRLTSILFRNQMNIGEGVIRKFAKEITIFRAHVVKQIKFLPDEFKNCKLLTYLYIYNKPLDPFLEIEDGTLKELVSLTQGHLYFYRVHMNILPDDSFYNALYIYFNTCNLSSESVDNAIIIAANSGYTGSRILYLAGNARRTHASDAALALLLSRGWTVTVLNPL